MRCIRCADGTLEVIGTINAPEYFASNQCFSFADWNAGIEFPTFEQVFGPLGCRNDTTNNIWWEATQHFAFLMQKEITHG